MKRKKAATPAQATRLEQIPNIGPAMAQDLRLLGLHQPSNLAGQDGYRLYVDLCRATGHYQDPCVLDTLLAAVAFMEGQGARPWWAFTPLRKANFYRVEAEVAPFRAKDRG